MVEPTSARRGAFPAGARLTQIPSVFFSDVVPLIEDRSELLVSLYAFYLAGHKPGAARWFQAAELLAATPLAQAFNLPVTEAEREVQRGLAAAVQRGTLLAGASVRDGAATLLYVLNMPGGAAMLARAGAAIGDVVPTEAAAEPRTVPNIFVLYEENIGVLSPLLADQMRDAAEEYPWPWIEAAFREAVALNRRNWRYIERILARWRSEGPDLEAIGRSTESHGRPSLAGRYWRVVRH